LLTGYLSATFEVGADGTLLYMAGGDVSRERHAVTVNEDGTLSDWSSERQPFQNWFWTSPDGQRIVTASNDGTARIYPLTPVDELLRLARERLRASVTAEEERAIVAQP